MKLGSATALGFYLYLPGDEAIEGYLSEELKRLEYPDIDVTFLKEEGRSRIIFRGWLDTFIITAHQMWRLLNALAQQQGAFVFYDHEKPYTWSFAERKDFVAFLYTQWEDEIDYLCAKKNVEKATFWDCIEYFTTKPKERQGKTFALLTGEDIAEVTSDGIRLKRDGKFISFSACAARIQSGCLGPKNICVGERDITEGRFIFYTDPVPTEIRFFKKGTHFPFGTGRWRRSKNKVDTKGFWALEMAIRSFGYITYDLS